MTGQPPPIDPRDRDGLAAQTAALATRYSGWRPPADGRPDAGQALIGIFARFAELVVQRLNQVPERNYLAFLNLIGTRPSPPLPARVPLTFHLAERSPADAVVPAGTQVAAPALAGEDDEVVFETGTDLVVTRAQLRSVVVADAVNDSYADRSAPATGQRDEPFAAFAGVQPVPHQLFVACDPVLAAEGSKDVTLVLSTMDSALLNSWPISWAYWDGEGWQSVAASATAAEGAWRVSLAGLPKLPPHDVNATTAGWLRAQLDMALPHGASGLAPTSVAVGRRAPQDDIDGVFPFGETGQGRRFYLDVGEQVAVAGATVRLAVALARPGVAADPADPASPVRLVWSYKVGDEWLRLGQSSSDAEQLGSGDAGLRDGSLAMTRDGEVSFRVPGHWPAELFQGRSGHWLRAEAVEDGGAYAELPRLASLTVGYDWDLPVVTGIDIQRETAPEPVPPPAAFRNSEPLDVTRDFYPFGEQPRFTDTCYLACPDDLARPGATLALAVTLTNAADGPVGPVNAGGNPRIAWEASDGTGWRAVGVDREEYAFAEDATLRLTLPAGFARTEVNGSVRYWLRIRLVGGDYGSAASYKKNTSGGYDLVPATFAPPVIAALSFTPGPAEPALTPADVCVTSNDFRFETYRRDTEAPSAFTPFTPNPERDPALCLGFDRPFDTRPVTLYLQVEPPDPEEVVADRLAGVDLSDRAELVWEYSGAHGWLPLAAVDETEALAGRGVVRFVGPADLTAREHFGASLCWLRLRRRHGAFPVPPRLRRILPNTTWASQASTITDEILGSGTAEAGQRLVTAQTPVLAGQHLLVREPGDPEEVWVRWHAVADFHRSGPLDRHYTVDARTGEIGFGDGQAGRVAPRGQNNIRVTYRTGGGAEGNRAEGSIVTLKSAVPYVDSVTNHEPSSGGSSWEPLERVRARGPKALRHRDRAVTAADVEDVAFESAAEVVRARAVLPSRFDPFDLWLDPADPRPRDAHTNADAATVGVIVVPDSTAPRPVPSLGLLRRVQTYLRARCAATTGLWVAGPEWVKVTVTATVVASSPDVAELVRGRVSQTFDRYLHPLTGGPDGTGWAFGRKPHRSDLYAAAEAVDGVDHIRSLEVAQVAESEELGGRLAGLLGRSLAQGAAEPQAPELARWLDRALVYSGPHQITVTLAGETTMPLGG